ncbi:hypothetical protein GCM10027157_21570 [Corynebacterium aquatimens]
MNRMTGLAANEKHRPVHPQGHTRVKPSHEDDVYSPAFAHARVFLLSPLKGLLVARTHNTQNI